MILIALVFSTFLKDSKFSSQIGFIILFTPVGLYDSIQLFFYDHKDFYYNVLSWIPQVPCLRIFQTLLGTYFNPNKKMAAIN